MDTWGKKQVIETKNHVRKKFQRRLLNKVKFQDRCILVSYIIETKNVNNSKEKENNRGKPNFSRKVKIFVFCDRAANHLAFRELIVLFLKKLSLNFTLLMRYLINTNGWNICEILPAPTLSDFSPPSLSLSYFLSPFCVLVFKTLTSILYNVWCQILENVKDVPIHVNVVKVLI